MKNIKSKIKIFLNSLLILLFLCSCYLNFLLCKSYITETPTGAWRYEMFKRGYIISSIFLDSNDYEIRFLNGDIIYDICNAPDYKVPLDGDYLDQWIVTKKGLSYHVDVYTW